MSFYDLVDDGPWWRNRGILLLNLSLLISLITSSANGFDSSMMNGLQIVPDWQYYFGNPSGSTLGMVNAVQNIGVLVALPMAPFISDTFGRKKSLLTGAFIMLGGVALQAASTNIWHFTLGITSPGMKTLINAILQIWNLIMALGGAMLVDRVGRRTLFVISNAGMLCAFSVWTVTAALYQLLRYCRAAANANIAFIFIFFSFYDIAYSPLLVAYTIEILPFNIRAKGFAVMNFSVCIALIVNRLLSQNRDAEAIEILGKYHANGNTSDPLVVLEYQEIREALILEKEITGEVSYFTLFKSPGNLKRMRIIIALGFFSQWSGNGLFSYYINEIFKTLGITSPGMKTLINAILQIWNLIMALGGAMLVDRVGRRTLFVISNAGMLCAFSVWTVTAALYQLLGNTAAANANIALIFIFFSFYDIAYSPLLVAYTIEILPFNIRAKGFAVMNFSVCIALIVNQYVNPVALNAIGWKYALVYCGWLLFEFIFVFRYIIETKGRSLEQTAALFDGEDHADALEQGKSHVA
ncbi:hypothetical protein RSAG8_02779, partial [Rhizoctonia solani AG-8 WAC10335]